MALSRNFALLFLLYATAEAVARPSDAPVATSLNTDGIRTDPEVSALREFTEKLSLELKSATQRLADVEANGRKLSDLTLRVDSIQQQGITEALATVRELEKQVDIVNLGSQTDTSIAELYRLASATVGRLRSAKFNGVRADARLAEAKILASCEAYVVGRKHEEENWGSSEAEYQKHIRNSLDDAINVASNAAIERQLLNDMVKHMDLFDGKSSNTIRMLLAGGGGLTSLVSGVTIIARGNEPVTKEQGIALAAGALATTGGLVWDMLQKNEDINAVANAVARNQAFADAARSIEAQAKALNERETQCLSSAVDKSQGDEVALALALGECMDITSKRITAYRAGADVLRGFIQNGGIAGIRPNTQNIDLVSGFITSLESKTDELRKDYERISKGALQRGAELQRLRAILPGRRETTVRLEKHVSEMKALAVPAPP